MTNESAMAALCLLHAHRHESSAHEWRLKAQRWQEAARKRERELAKSLPTAEWGRPSVGYGAA